MRIPRDATVLRICEQPDGTRDIIFENGDPQDYIWSTWSKSRWKSIDWLLGKVQDDQYGILEHAKTEVIAGCYADRSNVC